MISDTLGHIETSNVMEYSNYSINELSTTSLKSTLPEGKIPESWAVRQAIKKYSAVIWYNNYINWQTNTTSLPRTTKCSKRLVSENV